MVRNQGCVHLPALFRQVLPPPSSALKLAWSVPSSPTNRSRATFLTFDQFRFGSHGQAYRLSHQAHAPPR